MLCIRLGYFFFAENTKLFEIDTFFDYTNRKKLKSSKIVLFFQLVVFLNFNTLHLLKKLKNKIRYEQICLKIF